MFVLVNEHVFCSFLRVGGLCVTLRESLLVCIVFFLCIYKCLILSCGNNVCVCMLVHVYVLYLCDYLRTTFYVRVSVCVLICTRVCGSVYLCVGVFLCLCVRVCAWPLDCIREHICPFVC